jgi:hypothetical protein
MGQGVPCSHRPKHSRPREPPHCWTGSAPAETEKLHKREQGGGMCAAQTPFLQAPCIHIWYPALMRDPPPSLLPRPAVHVQSSLLGSKM